MKSPNPKSWNLSSTLLICLIGICALLLSCSSNDGDVPEEPMDNRSDEKQILSFFFSATRNNSLNGDIMGTLDQSSQKILVEVPFGTDLSSLIPTIDISQSANVNPDNLSPIDFSSTVIYTVTAENESTQNYEVMVSTARNSEKQILSFIIGADTNTDLSEDIIATIDESDKTIEASLPFSADITSLSVNLELSAEASATPSSNMDIDFTSPVVFTITADDGSMVEYTVSLIKNESDYETLINLFNANPANTLEWDFNNLDINSYSGVTAENDRVTALNLFGKGLTVLPAEIGDLSMLSQLYLQNNQITSIPPEIENLQNSLTQLLLSGNDLGDIPAEIGSLSNLEFLNLFNAGVTSIPVEIGNLSSLTNLNLGRNFSLGAIPSEIGNLSNLVSLSLTGANYVIPAEIGNLTNLTTLEINQANLTSFPAQVLNFNALEKLFLSGNDISTIPNQINALTSLTDLFLDNNSLTSLPEELAQINTLEILNITSNPDLTSISQEFCNLSNNNGLDLRKDTTTICN